MIAKVDVLIPPPKEPGAPPININAEHHKAVGIRIELKSTVENPAVLPLTVLKRDCPDPFIIPVFSNTPLGWDSRANNISIPNKFKNKLIISNPFIRKKYYEKNFKEKVNKIFTLMIIGGSQGAQIFDKIIHEVIVKISKINSLKIIHQTNQKILDF